MSDRILRDEIWESERFLDLPTDAARLVFIRFLSLADDFGNFEGGQRRIHRLLTYCTQLKTDGASEHVLDVLMSADLIRRYAVEGREFFHIPRFRSHRQYRSRKSPFSPWCDAADELGKTIRVKNQQLRKNVVATSQQQVNDVAGGVGVGVGVGEEKKKTSPPPPLGELPGFQKFWNAWPKSTRKGSKDQCIKLWRALRLETEFEEIVAHVVSMSKSQDWLKEAGSYIPAPLVYIRRKNWTGADLTRSEGMFEGSI